MRWKPLCQHRDYDGPERRRVPEYSGGRRNDPRASEPHIGPDTIRNCTEILPRKHRAAKHLSELLGVYLNRVRQVAHDNGMTVAELLSSDGDDDWAISQALPSPDEYAAFMTLLAELED